MEKNYIKAIVLCLLILVFYQPILKWIYPEAFKPAPVQTAELSKEQKPSSLKTEAPAEKILEKAERPSFEVFQNDLYKIEFSTLGGTVSKLAYRGEPGRRDFTQTDFFSSDPQTQGIFGLDVLHETAKLSQTVFRLEKADSANGKYSFVYEIPGEYSLTKEYTAHNNAPVIDLKIRIKNLSPREKNFSLEMAYSMNYEKDFHQQQGFYDAVAYSDKIKTSGVDKLKKKTFIAPPGTAWAGFIKKYFALLIKPDGKIVASEAKANETSLLGEMILEPLSIPAGDEKERSFLIYAGPQRYEELKSFGEGFESVFSRGFFGLFKTWLLIVLKFLYGFTHNFGWAIVILTLLIKLLFAPLTHVSYASIKKMQALAPKQKAIQERYKNDPAKMQRETMELYRRNKVNPVAGCLPILLQIPVFFAMFRLLPEAIELHGAPFIWWIKDLSAPDHFMKLPFTIPMLGSFLNLLPILMVFSQIGQQKLMPQQPGAAPEQAMMMNWFMPIFLGFMCYNMPAGVTLYWFLQNLFSIIHQIFINRIVIVLHHEDR